MISASRISLLLLAALTALLLASCQSTLPDNAQTAQSADGQDYLVYFGTYTRGDGGSQGIYVSRLSAAGELSAPELAAETPNPSFLAIHPNGRYVYSVSELYDDDGKRSGAVSSFEIANKQTGKLTLLNTESSGGNGPCHLNVDQTGRCLVVANYGSGSVAALPVGGDGRLAKASAFIQHAGSSVHPQRQQGPHAHSVNYSPDNRFVIAADLGLDQVIVYRFDPEEGSLAANEPPFAKVAPGGGPRHFAFHPSGKYAYVINELSSTVTAFSYDAATGTLTELQTVATLPDDFEGANTTAEVQVHPSGKFVYGSNRGHDSIAIFQVDAASGKLSPVDRISTQGQTPRNFGISPDGTTLIAANQKTNNVVVFRIDQETGRFSPTGQEYEIGAPVCVKFLAVD